MGKIHCIKCQKNLTSSKGVNIAGMEVTFGKEEKEVEAMKEIEPTLDPSKVYRVCWSCLLGLKD